MIKLEKMAAIPEEINNQIWFSCKELISIINSAKFAEYILFNKQGETENTINDLDTLQNIALEVADSYQQLSNIALRTATIQPQANAATLSILVEKLNEIGTRTPAWLRSIEEIITDWRLLDE